MDEDNNGMISFEELWKGYEEVSEFKKLMEVMDLKREDMATVFNVLDTDFNHEVPYLELCQHLGSFFKRDPVIMQSLVRYSVMEVRKVLENEVVDLLQQQTQMLRLLLQEKGFQLPPMPPTSPLVSQRITSATSQPEKKPRVRKDSSTAPTGGVVLGRLSQDLSILEAELQPLFAKAQELADSIAAESVREHTIDVDNMAMNLQFNELSQRFEARIQDVQRLQQRCGGLLRPLESREAQALHEAHEVHETHEAQTLSSAEGNASEATSLTAFPT